MVCIRCRGELPLANCSSHGGPAQTTEVKLRGLPRPQPVQIHLNAVCPDIVTRVHETVVRQDVVITHSSKSSPTKIDVLFAVYHTDSDWEAAVHEQKIVEAMGESAPSLVFVLACWESDAMTTAWTRLSHMHPAITFVVYRVPRLVLLPEHSEYLRHSVLAAVNTIRYPDAPGYMYLADLCTVSKQEAVIFHRGVGPLQVSYNVRPRCCCGKEYPLKLGTRWCRPKRGTRIWLRKCQDFTHIAKGCVYLLYVVHQANHDLDTEQVTADRTFPVKGIADSILPKGEEGMHDV